MEKKQTAVEWLNKWHIDNPYATHIEWAESLMKAKEMEKEQIIDAFYQCGKDNFEHIKIINRSAVEYYNETYGKETDNTGMDIR